MHQVPDATTGSEHEVSEYGAYDDESIEADDDEDPGVFSDDATISDEEDDSYSRVSTKSDQIIWIVLQGF